MLCPLLRPLAPGSNSDGPLGLPSKSHTFSTSPPSVFYPYTYVTAPTSFCRCSRARAAGSAHRATRRKCSFSARCWPRTSSRRFPRGLIRELCRIAHRCLAGFQRATPGLPQGVPGVVLAIHTFGEYPDFHPHLHALVADGIFMEGGLFHVMPDLSLAPLEEIFRARVITFLVKKGQLLSERARVLRGWTHPGFDIHRSQRVPPGNRVDIERLAQYIIRNPFSADKIQPNRSGDSIIYCSGMNPKIQRNFGVFSPCDFTACIT